MRGYFAMHQICKLDRYLLGKEIHDSLTATRKYSMFWVNKSRVDRVIKEAMVTSKLNAIFEKQLKGIYGESNSKDINS